MIQANKPEPEGESDKVSEWEASFLQEAGQKLTLMRDQLPSVFPGNDATVVVAAVLVLSAEVSNLRWTLQSIQEVLERSEGGA